MVTPHEITVQARHSVVRPLSVQRSPARGSRVSHHCDSAPYTLFGTSACHLCEVAEAMLLELAGRLPELEFKKVDISESDELFQRYGIRIPVLANATGEELGWPFSTEELESFVSQAL